MQLNFQTNQLTRPKFPLNEVERSILVKIQSVFHKSKENLPQQEML